MNDNRIRLVEVACESIEYGLKNYECGDYIGALRFFNLAVAAYDSFKILPEEVMKQLKLEKEGAVSG